MTLTRPEARTRRVDLGRSAEERPRFAPVKAWATFGVFILAIQAIAYTGWLTSGEATRTPTGSTPVPTWMKIFIHGWEVSGIFFCAIFLWFFLVRPWRREGRIGLDGLFCIAFLSMYWLDTAHNYFQPWVTYNAEFINWGSWNPHILGWLSPRGNLVAEPPIWALPGYIYLIFGPVVALCWIMGKARKRWPSMGNFGLVLFAFTCFAIFDITMETLFMRLGVYTYAGAIQDLSINAGKYYQLPLHEVFLWSAGSTAFACLRFFRNDKGQTMAERGVDLVRCSPRRRTGLRLLALIGACNVIYLGYYIPLAVYGIYSDPWPQDVLERSYFTNGLCGPGTPYSCPGRLVPIPRNAVSGHLDPNGEYVKPGAGRE
jgi:hypothetical protein